MINKLLITGGSGFIGTNVISYYKQKENLEILNIDIQKPKLDTHIPFWKKIDLREKDKLVQVVRDFKPTHIIHLAARTDLDGLSLSDYDSNTVGVSNLLTAIKQAPNLERALFTSSMLVCKLGYQPSSMYDYNPSTLYGESKVITEELVREKPLPFSWAILRPTSIWGPWFGAPYRNFFDMVIAKKYVHIGNRSCTKTYGYVENTVYQIRSILEAESNPINGKAFYLGDYEPYNLKKWADEVAEQLDQKIIKMPFGIIKTAALTGDMLKKLGISFPMTSFRLKNMTTDNIMDMSETQKVAPDLPINRKDGIKKTLAWLNAKK